MTRVYLSGPMSGMKDFNFPEFNAAEKKLRELGYDVYNPAGIPLDKNYAGCMRECIPAIFTCNSMVVLGGWEHSKGARLEVAVARAIDMPVLEMATMQRCELAYSLDLLKPFVNGN